MQGDRDVFVPSRIAALLRVARQLTYTFERCYGIDNLMFGRFLQKKPGIGFRLCFSY